MVAIREETVSKVQRWVHKLLVCLACINFIVLLVDKVIDLVNPNPVLSRVLWELVFSLSVCGILIYGVYTHIMMYHVILQE